MRAVVDFFQMKTARTFSELFDLLENPLNPHLPFAGGTDLMVQFESGRLKQKLWVSLHALSDLAVISNDGTTLRIGARATYADIIENSVIQKHFPMLASAARETGAYAIQNRGTIGGNIANASPAADTPPALIAYGAMVELRNRKSARTVPYDMFHLGYKSTAIMPGEIISAVTIDFKKNQAQSDTRVFQSYRKVGTRKAQAISKICCALIAHINDDKIILLRAGLGSVAPIPLYPKHLCNWARDKNISAIKRSDFEIALFKDIAPIDDIRSTRDYRMEVCARVVEDIFDQMRTPLK